jgi:hypothetical protein
MSIRRIDDITLDAAGAAGFLDRLRSDYEPAARARGLELVDVSWTRRRSGSEEDARVVVTWQLADVDAFWVARRAAITDPSVVAFWDDAASVITSRTRRFEHALPVVRDDDPGADVTPRRVHHIVLLDRAQVTNGGAVRHLPGSVGGPGASMEIDADAPVTVDDVPAPADSVVDIVVLGETLEARARQPDLCDGIKRTLLLRVDDGTPGEVIDAFERDLLGMPRHIPAIRNWRLSRISSSSAGWTHAWEQEYVEPAGLLEDYMGSPYHWGVVDGWFDAEDPRCIVAPDLIHVFHEIPVSILG